MTEAHITGRDDLRGEGTDVFAGAAVLTTTIIGAPSCLMSEEECVRHGGHCFERTGITLTSNPPQYPERCKHCGKGRVAIPREPFTYRDWP